MLSDIIKQKIKEYALKDKPNECCGLIVSKGNVKFLFPCKNIASNKENYFEMCPHDYLKASRENKIIGMYHRQCNAGASLYDYIISYGHNIYSIVYSWKTDSFFEINSYLYKYIKYIGKEFEIGKQDCFSLIREFYKNEYNININNYNRKDGWEKDNPNIIQENYLKEGFTETDLLNIKEGNIIEFGNYHFGIYINNNLLLHHRRNKLSNVEPLNDEYKRKITHCYKYKNE